MVAMAAACLTQPYPRRLYLGSLLPSAGHVDLCMHSNTGATVWNMRLVKVGSLARTASTQVLTRQCNTGQQPAWLPPTLARPVSC